MNEKIKKHLEEYNKAQGWSTYEDSLIETVREAKVIWTGDREQHRWWTDCFQVVNINGLLIGFWGAETTGDESPQEKGWEFDPETICEVRGKDVITTIYERIE